MGNIDFGTISGSGVLHLDDVGVVVTNVHITVSNVGPHVSAKGPAGHRKLQMAGWMRFQNSAYGATAESVYDPLYFNWETEDLQTAGNPLSLQATDFSYWIPPGTEVQVNVFFVGSGSGGTTVVTGAIQAAGTFGSWYDPPTTDPNGTLVPTGATTVRLQMNADANSDGGEHGTLLHGPDYWNPYDSGGVSLPLDETFAITTTYVRVALISNTNPAVHAVYTLTFS